MGCLSGVRQEKKHLAVRSVHEEKHYSVNRLCDILNLNRSSYYKWLRRKESQVETENRRIIEWVKELYEEQNGILGYDDNDSWPPRSPVAMWFDDTILDDFVKDWAAVQKKLYAGEITQAEYFEWKIMWPDEV